MLGWNSLVVKCVAALAASTAAVATYTLPAIAVRHVVAGSKVQGQYDGIGSLRGEIVLAVDADDEVPITADLGGKIIGTAESGSVMKALCVSTDPRDDRGRAWFKVFDGYWVPADRVEQVLSQGAPLPYCPDEAGFGQVARDVKLGVRSAASRLTPPTTPASQSPPQPQPVVTRETKAVGWAENQIGAAYQADGHPWDGWCDRFVATAYGRVNSGYASAYAHYRDMMQRGMIHTDRNPPAGALTFFAPTKYVPEGHVMLSIGAGRFVTTGKTVRHETWAMSGIGPFLGWSYANPEWPGR